jgi:hypothetical protein
MHCFEIMLLRLVCASPFSASLRIMFRVKKADVLYQQMNIHLFLSFLFVLESYVILARSINSCEGIAQLVLAPSMMPMN